MAGFGLWKSGSAESVVLKGELIERDGNVELSSNGNLKAAEFVEGNEWHIDEAHRVMAVEFIESGEI